MRARNNRERIRENRKREAKEAGRTFSTDAQGNEIRKKKEKENTRKRKEEKRIPPLSQFIII